MNQTAIEKIREKYVEKEKTDIDILRELDAKVHNPANVFAYAFGTVSALTMGAGMSLVMTDIGQSVGIGGNAAIIGVIIGAAGLLLSLVNLPLHNLIISRRKRRYSKEIIALSDKLIENL